jgi:hypothetical protein
MVAAGNLEGKRKICYRRRSEDVLRAVNASIENLTLEAAKQTQSLAKAHDSHSRSFVSQLLHVGHQAWNLIFAASIVTKGYDYLANPIACAQWFMGVHLLLLSRGSWHNPTQAADEKDNLPPAVADYMCTSLNHYIDTEVKDRLCTEQQYLDWPGAQFWQYFCTSLQ